MTIVSASRGLHRPDTYGNPGKSIASTLSSRDVHCHCLPGLDDGPADMAAALALCRALVRDRVSAVIATPHQSGPYEGRNAPDEVREAVDTLRVALQDESLDLEVFAGGDVRIDESLADQLNDDRVLTLGDTGKYLLLELPHEGWIPPSNLIMSLVTRGLVPIVSHPERNPRLATFPKDVEEILQSGAVLQITAGSLMGDFGRRSATAAWRMLELGQVSLVASDAHDATRRPPRMAAARSVITRRLGPQIARQLCVDNPERIIKAARRIDRERAASSDSGISRRE